MSAKAARTIRSLFDAFINDSGLLPDETQRQTAVLEERHGTRGKARSVADYIAGMTDRYAISEYQRIYDPGSAS